MQRQYRPDIDGLRALAVLLVLMYHFGFKPLSGGFIGVDIFFVISGYLITSILVSEIKNSTFSFSSFWLRRVRRLLPAALTMSFTVLCVFAAIYPDSLFKEIGESLVSQLFFVSNIYFWSGSGYFSLDAELKPLLHTWSLSVEEQFYLFYPIYLYVVCKFFASHLLAITVLGTFISFIFSLWLFHEQPSAAFYWLPARAWELGIGGCLALMSQAKSKFVVHSVLATTASLSGFVLIMISALLFDSSTLFPYISVLLPVLGTSLIIWGNGHTNNVISKLFSWSPIVYIGLISYSLYLWHWPIKVFLSWYSIPLNSIWTFLIASIVTLIAGSMSYHFIELPFRSRRKKESLAYE